MYKDTQVAEMLQEKDDKISELEKEIVSLNTYIGELENELNNHKALQGYIKDQPVIETCRGQVWKRNEDGVVEAKLSVIETCRGEVWDRTEEAKKWE